MVRRQADVNKQAEGHRIRSKAAKLRHCGADVYRKAADQVIGTGGIEGQVRKSRPRIRNADGPGGGRGRAERGGDITRWCISSK